MTRDGHTASGGASGPDARSGARRLVVKVGSSLVTADGRGLDNAALAGWAAQIAALVRDGREVVLVSSGAIAEGMRRLGWARRPSAVHDLQAAAAVGQMGLVQAYERCFAGHGLIAAQVLLTHEDLADRQRYLNARSTLTTLLELGVVPIINENDTVATDEIRFGDNDTLGALVTNLIEAELLVILTDQPGLYTADPRKDASATLVTEAQAGDPALEAMAGGAGTGVGTGGMLTKVLAARRAARSGADTVIASGRQPDVLARLLAGEAVGTRLCSGTAPMAARKQWLADHLQTHGSLVLDDGAARAGRRWPQPSGRGCVYRHRRVRARRGGGLPRWQRPLGGTGSGELQRRRDAPHHRPAEQRDRGQARLRQRARTHPPRQSRHPVSAGGGPATAC